MLTFKLLVMRHIHVMQGPNFKLLCIYTATGHTHSPSSDVVVKSMYFQMFCKKILSKNYKSYNFEKVPNESKLIYAINVFIVASRFLLFSYGSNLNANTN